MVWDWVFALVNSLEKCRLSTAVLSKKTISATVCKFEGSIRNEDSAVEYQGN
jgi:hypothetical protein